MFHTRGYRRLVILLLVLGSIQPVRINSHEPQSEQLGKGLRSLKVVPFSDNKSTVAYIPVGVRWVDSAGHVADSVDTITVSGSVIVSGRLSLYAEVAEVQKLERQAQKLLGHPVKAKIQKPTSAWIWLIDGEKVIWNREIPGPSFERIPVQLTVDTNSAVLHETLTGVVLVTSETRAVPMNIRLSIDWSEVRSHLKEVVSSDNGLLDENLSDVYAFLLQSHHISYKYMGSGNNNAIMSDAARLAFLDLARSKLTVPTTPVFTANSSTKSRKISILFGLRGSNVPSGNVSYDLRNHLKRTVLYLQEFTLNVN